MSDTIELVTPHHTPVPHSAARRAFSWKEALLEAGWIFLLSRLLILLIMFVGVSEFMQFGLPGHPPIKPQECALNLAYCFHAWNMWDFTIFIHVAQYGYTIHPEYAALFPLWPLLMRLSVFYHPSYNAIFTAGLVLANLFFFAALTLLYRLVSTEFDASIARNALLLLTFNPYGIFFFLGYNESLFLLLCLGLFFFLKRGRPLDWWLAGFCGFFAILTRGTGLILIIPFLIILFQYFWPQRSFWRERWGSLFNAALPILLIPVALGLFMFFLYTTQGDAIAFSSWEHQIWKRHLTFPWTGFVLTIADIQHEVHVDGNIRHLLFTLIPLAILTIGWKKLPWLYRIFSATMMIFSLCYVVEGRGHPLVGTPRFLMVIFPLCIISALWCRHPRLKIVLLSTSITLWVIGTLIFLTHSQVRLA